jgi:hypothetical protein
VARMSAMTIRPPGFKTRKPSTMARLRSAFDRMLWIARLDTTRSKLASGYGSARMSLVSILHAIGDTFEGSVPHWPMHDRRRIQREGNARVRPVEGPSLGMRPLGAEVYVWLP